MPDTRLTVYPLLLSLLVLPMACDFDGTARTQPDATPIDSGLIDASPDASPDGGMFCDPLSNTSPVLADTASPTLATIDEDLPGPADGTTDHSTLVSDLIDSGGPLDNYSDADTCVVGPGIAVIGISSEGTLYYSTNGGTTWQAAGAVGADAALLLNADADTRVFFAPAGDVNGTIADAITFLAWDRVTGTNGASDVDTTVASAFSAASDTVSIDIAAINDDPTITALPTDITATEESASDVDLSAATLVDVDAGSGSITLIVTAGSGTLVASSGGGVTVIGTGTSELSLVGAVADLNGYLDTASNIQYTGAKDVSGNDADTLTLSANDSGNSGAGGGTTVELGAVNVDITNVNDAPTVSNLNGDAVTFSVAGAAVLLDNGGNAAVADVDSADFNGGNVTVSITANRVSTEDQLLIGTVGNISTSGSSVLHGGMTIGTFTGGTSTNNLVITLNANATPARAQDLIRALQYWNSNASTVNTTSRTVSITVDDGDGGISSSQNVTVALVIAPTVDLDGNNSSGASGGDYNGAFTEGGGEVPTCDSDSSVTDDGIYFKSLTVTLTNRPDGAAESLRSTYGTGAQTVPPGNEAVTIGSYNSGTGVLTITVDDGQCIDQVMENLMESIRYDNSSTDPDTSDRIITYRVTDYQDNTSPASTATITVTAVP